MEMERRIFFFLSEKTKIMKEIETVGGGDQQEVGAVR